MLLLIAINVVVIRADLTVLEPTNFVPSQGMAPYLYGRRDFDITGYVALVTPCCQDCPLATDNFTIALLNRSTSGCSLQTVARALELSGYSLVLVSGSSLTREPGDLYFGWDGSDYLNMVPVVQIEGVMREAVRNATLEDNSTRILVRVLDNVSNRWVDYWHSPGVLTGYIIVGIISLGLLGLSIWKLVQFFKAFGPQVSIPIVSLVMEALSNLARILWCVDPIGASRVLDTLGRLIILTISLPFVIIVTVLTAFYWYELISKRIKSGVWIGKTQLPFFIICAALIVMEIIFDVLRGLYIESGVTITLQGVVYVIYAAMLIASSLFFFVIGTKVLRFLNKTSKHKLSANGASKRLFIKTILMVVGNGVFNLILVVAFGLVIFMSTTPESQFGLYMFLMLTLCIISGAHIMAFNTPDLKKSSSKSKKSRSKNDTDDRSVLTNNSSTVNVPMEAATGDLSPRAPTNADSTDNNIV